MLFLFQTLEAQGTSLNMVQTTTMQEQLSGEGLADVAHI